MQIHQRSSEWWTPWFRIDLGPAEKNEYIAEYTINFSDNEFNKKLRESLLELDEGLLEWEISIDDKSIAKLEWAMGE